MNVCGGEAREVESTSPAQQRFSSALVQQAVGERRTRRKVLAQSPPSPAPPYFSSQPSTEVHFRPFWVSTQQQLPSVHPNNLPRAPDSIEFSTATEPPKAPALLGTSPPLSQRLRRMAGLVLVSSEVSECLVLGFRPLRAAATLAFLATRIIGPAFGALAAPSPILEGQACWTPHYIHEVLTCPTFVSC